MHSRSERFSSFFSNRNLYRLENAFDDQLRFGRVCAFIAFTRQTPAGNTSFINDFLEVPRLKLIWIDAKLHNQAMELLANRLDKKYSLCDAASFVVMREHDAIEALTTDKHFKQDGFVKLLQS